MYKLTLCFFFLISSCLSSTSSSTKTAKSLDSKLIGKIISVKDGDSLELLDAENTIHDIRLAHVDCPEKKQAFGTRAKVFTANFCFGEEVTVVPTDKDRYGRIVGVVIVDRKELNLALVEEGMAWHFKKYSKEEKYTTAEEKARRKKKGLWSHRNPVAPWEYRKR